MSRRKTRGRVRAGPSLQLGTLSTRIANLLCIIHSALSRLSSPPHVQHHDSSRATPGPSVCAMLRTARCYAPHTHSGLAALCCTRTDKHATQTDTTYQPTAHPDSQPFCQYPAVSWEFARGHPKGTCQMRAGWFFSAIFDQSSYLENGAFYTQSYYRTAISK